MIDAYEIGIQLLLQDDVTAGLSIIEKELADVDRAVAAASADLLKLTQGAERAARAVAAVYSNKAIAAEGPLSLVQQAPESPTKAQGLSELEHSTNPSVTPVPPLTTLEPAPLPKTVSETTPAAAVVSSKTVSLAQPEARAARASLTAVSAFEDRSAPVREPESGAPSERIPTPPAQRDALNPHKPARTPGAPEEFAVAPLAHPSSNLLSPSNRPVVTAYIDEPDREHRRNNAREPSQDRVVPFSRPAQETAPRRRIKADHRSHVQSGSGDTRSNTIEGQRSSPQEMSGTVMLDGRLVGQFLSNLMAQEASRPPSGTSFFDPRQTPAWHNSGAL